MRLIDADKLKEALCWDCPDYEECIGPFRQYCTFMYSVDEQPTVDAVKHGEWKTVQTYGENMNASICECSLCGDTVWVYLNAGGKRKWKFCPNCGARMDLSDSPTGCGANADDEVSDERS